MNLYELKTAELKKKSGVYKLSAGGHIYIGSSKNLYDRLLEHRRDLFNNRHDNQFLQNISNKYGIENIDVEVIEYCDPEIRVQREGFWIKELNADVNQADPITHEFSEESKKKLSNSIKEGILKGKYKTKFDLHEVECYDYLGNYICTYKDKDDAAEKLNITKDQVQKLASGYKKGLSRKGVRLRYSDSIVPVQKFPINEQYLGRQYNFYYIDDNGEEKLAFHDVKDMYPFFAKQIMKGVEKIELFPKVKFRESAKLPLRDNANPSITEM